MTLLRKIIWLAETTRVLGFRAAAVNVFCPETALLSAISDIGPRTGGVAAYTTQKSLKWPYSCGAEAALLPSNGGHGCFISFFASLQAASKPEL